MSSLDMMDGDVSSLDGRVVNAEAMEEDYCRTAAQRFREHWMQHGSFHPAALRHYGVRGDVTLMRSLLQSRSFGAAFGTFTLGDLRDFSELPAPVTVAHTNPNASSRQAVKRPVTRGLNGDFDVPMGSVLLGPAADPQLRAGFSPEETKAMNDELARSWVTLTQPSEWSRAMCGVLTIGNWATAEQRARARHQLSLASFMGVKAVQVPLPMLVNGRWQATETDTDWDAPTRQQQEDITSAEYAERNWQMLGEVADILAAFLRDGDAAPKVWVRCDVCYPLQRRQFHALRSLVLYGAERRSSARGDAVVVGPRPVDTNTACERIRREALHAIVAMLFFSNPYALSSFSTEWLGEDIATFEVPPADVMLRCLQPASTGDEHAGATTTAHGTLEESGADYDYGIPSPLLPHPDEGDANADTSTAGLESASAQYSYGELLHGTGEESDPASHSGLAASAKTGDGCESSQRTDTSANAPYPTETSPEHPIMPPQQPPRNDHTQQRGSSEAGPVWQLPDDLLPRTESRWGGYYPARVSLVTFVVELMRRRATPLFSQFFFDHYAIVNFLHFTAVADNTRDNFIGFEDVLQLPLQPLGHQLSSGVYEVFERDASKYRQYREAFYAFTLDWVNANAETHHHATRCRAFAELNAIRETEGNDDTADTLTMYVVLLGSGRGPLIDEILSAASSLGVRVRLFAVEKNAPAAAFTELRWRCDPEWVHLSEAFGHTLATIVADGRTIYDRRQELDLPADFGLCDVVVSELLGSFGDNELSPECIEGFVAQLKKLQEEKADQGLSFHPHMACIPESYTAWAAPMHAVHLEQAVADAAIKGLTVRPDDCEDRHAALFHSMFVSDISRGILLAPPQPCWSFHHRWEEEDATSASSNTERHATLRFNIAPQGRCSGVAGFFSSVLYTPRNPEGGDVVRSPIAVNEGSASKAITMSTVPIVSTRAMVDGRTEDMYSWFPCFFPLDPSRVRDFPLAEDHVAAAVTGSAGGAAAAAASQSKSASTTVCFDIGRHVDQAQKRVWYEWRVDYGLGPRGGSGTTTNGKAGVKGDVLQRRTVVHNEDGWASTVLL